MNEDMKYGYNVCGQRLNEEIDTVIDEIHSAYMNSTDEKTKDRLDAQMKILWNFKSRIEDAIADEKLEKLFEDENGYVYPVEDGYKVHWKNEKFKPDVDIKFSNHWEAHHYLRSVSR